MLIQKMLNIGIRESDSSLYKLRVKALNFFIFLNLGFLLYFILLFSINNNEYQAYSHQNKVNIIAFLLFFISIVLSKYRKLNLAVLIAGTLTVFTISNLSYGETILNSRTSPELGLVIAFITILINGIRARILFLVIVTFLTGYITYDTIGSFSFARGLILEDVRFMTLFFFFVIGLEKIDLLLTDTLSQLTISNNKNMELNAQLSIKNEELITFSGIMTHDLKTPLTTIISYADLIDRSKINTLNEKKQISIIKKNAHSMSALIDDTLQLMHVKNKSFNKESINLNKIVDEVITGLHSEIIQKNITIKKEELPSVIGNKLLIKTVFHNLISNSIKYQPKDENHKPQIILSFEDMDSECYVYIEDNGIGIREKYIPNLFQPYKRFHSSEEYKGTGLGMSICEQVMKKIDGNITLLKTSPKGSVFKLKFLKD